MAHDSSSSSKGIKESALVWPMLTQTNYVEWAMLMQINYEVLEIWEVINPKTNVKRSEDRQAMGVLMRSIPKEMWGTLGVKKMMKEAWETVKTMKVGTDYMKEISVQKLIKDFENIEFKDAESVEDFGMCINLVATLKTLSETIDDLFHIIYCFLFIESSTYFSKAVSRLLNQNG
jgi:hypothetical protein